MQTELVSSVMPTGTPMADAATAAQDAPADGPFSFASLLDAAAGEAARATADDQSEDEGTSSDEWMTLPVANFGVPTIPAENAADPATGAPGAGGKEPAPKASGDEPTAAARGNDAVSEAALAHLLPGNGTGPTDPEQVLRANIDGASGVPAAQAAGDAPAEAIAQATPQAPAAASLAAQDRPIDGGSNKGSTAGRAPGTIQETATRSGAAVPGAPLAASPGDARSVGGTQSGLTPAETAAGDTSAAAALSADAVDPAARDNKGAAARFARALERAADPSAIHQAGEPAAENRESFTPGDDAQRSRGEWLRDQLPLAASGRTQAIAAPVAFSMAAALDRESGTSATLAPFGAGSTSAGAGVIADERSVAMQLVRSLRMQFRDGIGEAVLRLKPEHLGAVAVSLRIENGGLKASVQAESPAVRQWLESQQDTLRNALAEHGLRLDRFDVDPEGQRQSREESQDEPPARRRRHRQSPQPGDPVFEVIV